MSLPKKMTTPKGRDVDYYVSGTERVFPRPRGAVAKEARPVVEDWPKITFRCNGRDGTLVIPPEPSPDEWLGSALDRMIDEWDSQSGV